LESLYRNINNGNSITVFNVDSMNLTKYTTTKDDLKKKISRMPGIVEDKKEVTWLRNAYF